MELENKTYKNIIISFMIGIFLSTIPVLIHGDAYCRDDMQAQYMPMFYAIGRTITQEYFVPFITTHTWFGGNIIGEFQYGIFNPIEIILYSSITFISYMPYAAAFMAIIHYGILSSGMFFLSKAVGASDKYSYVASVAIVTNNFIYYWYASSWFPQFTSISFMLWAMAFTLKADQTRGYFLGAVVSVYLMITVGFPQTIVAFFVFGGIYSCLEIFKRKTFASFLPMIAIILGALAALISFLPSMAMLSVSDRNTTTLFSAGSLIPQIGDLFYFSNPVHPSHMIMMSYRNFKAAHFYIAWFILPLMFFIDWKNVRNLSSKFLTVAISMFIFVIMTQGPEHFGPLRLPFRYIAFFQIFLIISMLYLFDKFKCKYISRYRIYFFAITLFSLDLVSALQNPNKRIFIFVSFIFCMYFGIRIAKKNMPISYWILITVIFSVFSRATGGFYNSVTPDWQIFPEVSEQINLNSVNPYYNMCLVDDVFNKRWQQNSDKYIKDIWFGNIGLAQNKPSVNGYSPIKQSGLSRRFFYEVRKYTPVHGTTPIEAGIRGLEIEPTTGLSFFDLMRVKNVIAFNGEQADIFDRVKTQGWRKIENKKYSTVFSHELPNQILPGTLSWPLKGVSISEPSIAMGNHEILILSSRNVNKLIFARTYWPGYVATFNGAPVPVSPFAGFMVSVDLPADQSSGTLDLSYHMPYFKFSVLLLIFSSLLTIIVVSLNTLWKKNV
ncbi:hypothetical protein GOB83_13840 [Acetobacter fabarum]|uniref:hypothetical protein n=1 Tax=Acetobacter fabarum TaxID=483199 RepID=UPI0014052F18|nr:hypothetical protein [Acetobacter fabarum]NHO43236.1 hypothetical protein [Acetobacter fabarum]